MNGAKVARAWKFHPRGWRVELGPGYDAAISQGVGRAHKRNEMWHEIRSEMNEIGNGPGRGAAGGASRVRTAAGNSFAK